MIIRRYYTVMTLSNVDCSGKPLVEDQYERVLLCTWIETPIDSILDEVTNTICLKPLRELVTGTIIYPETEDDLFHLGLPRVLKYDKYPQAFRITRKEAMERLFALQKDRKKLREYAQYIKDMKDLVKVARREDAYQKRKR